MSIAYFIWFVAVFFLIAGAAAITVHARQTFSPAETLAQEQAHVSYWEDTILVLGPRVAYQQFGEAVAHLNFVDQHEEAHLFGRALFYTEGINGLSVCDYQFSFGCQHEFIEQTIAKYGTSTMPALLSACTKGQSSAVTPCGHGIGHGLMDFFSDDMSDQVAAANAALALCPDQFALDQPAGCGDGVFMQFNFGGMEGLPGSIPRPVTSDMDYPCDAVATQYQGVCYFEQPDWWHQVLSGDQSSIFTQMGALCGALGGTSREYCFEGVAQIAVEVALLDPTGSYALCADATKTNPDGGYCSQWVGQRLLGGT